MQFDLPAYHPGPDDVVGSADDQHSPSKNKDTLPGSAHKDEVESGRDPNDARPDDRYDGRKCCPKRKKQRRRKPTIATAMPVSTPWATPTERIPYTFATMVSEILPEAVVPGLASAV